MFRAGPNFKTVDTIVGAARNFPIEDTNTTNMSKPTKALHKSAEIKERVVTEAATNFPIVDESGSCVVTEAATITGSAMMIGAAPNFQTGSAIVGAARNFPIEAPAPKANIITRPELPTRDESAPTMNNTSRYLPLHKATLSGDWKNAIKFLEKEPNGVRDAITIGSETALMLAVRSISPERNDFAKKLIEIMLPEDLALGDNRGQTALDWTVESTNIKVAKLLVEKNPELPNIGSLGGSTLAVHWAALRGDREMVDYLLEVTEVNWEVCDDGRLGLRLLINLACGGLYDIASTFLQSHPNLASMEPSPSSGDVQELVSREPSPLMAMVHYSSFRSGTRFNFFQHLIYNCIPLKLEGNANKPKGRDVENSSKGVDISPLGHLSEKLHAIFWDVAEKLVSPIKRVREMKLIHHQAHEFVKQFCEEVVKSKFAKPEDIFRAPLLEAASWGPCEIVEEILESFPYGIQLPNEKWQTIFHVAIENRQENVFNLIYQLEEHNKNWFLSQLDKSENNALHIAGNFTSGQKLSLRARVAGAALQMQRELQWYKEVEKLSYANDKYIKNNEKKTPQDIFTETHKDLVEGGEKWMKDTASSCTIVAALVVTIVFAAAITVPGGINGDNGLPIFLDDGVFFLFGMFDALALFSSTTSLLMFLSILTARYGEQDFLYSLPRKLIIGLVTLFLSILFMMVAFATTLKIVFGHKKGWIIIPVALFSCVPVTLFALLQFPLLLAMIQSTYYPSLFRKRSDRILF